ncbi:MAG TPA: ABC transporter permease [Candidatus Acidoferrum sp.]|nr:ABC transporter permease [Candidatus Acidoferrum sp.]
MRFLSIADRELRSAARQKATYRARWLTAVVFLGLFFWLMWVFDGFTSRRVAPRIFSLYSFLIFLYCLFLATARTGDCLSVEKREGTLGLLFLTNLNSAEIITGKLCSTALASVYGLLAVFPMLALPMLMGGISFSLFGRIVLGLLNGILFALAAGFLASAVCKRQFNAIALAMGLMIGVGGGLLLGAAAAEAHARTRPLAPWLAGLSPLYCLIAADGTRLFGRNHFWGSAGAVAGMSFSCLGLTTLLLARTWRDRPEGGRAWRRLRFWRRSERSFSAKAAALRQRLLAINPLFWLSSRQVVGAPVFMFLAVVLTLITVYVTAPYFARVTAGGVNRAVLGQLIAWLFTGLAIHALVLYYAAMAASQRLAEDKQTGALELILGTSTTERTISRGLWLGYWRRMFFPALLAVLVHGFFLWVVLVMATLDPPGPIPPGTTPGELFWCALFNLPLRGRPVDWQFGIMLRIVLLILAQMVVAWVTLGWVGRWLGLRMKHPGFAPMASVVLLLVPPIFLFTLTCGLFDKLQLYQLPPRRLLPILVWLAFAMGCAHCLVLSAWASTRLRRQLRSVAMSRYQPLSPWRWRLPSRRTVWRFALGMAVVATALALLGLGYYRYQNWRSERAWRAFQTALKQHGQSLNLSLLLPAVAPDSANLARSPAFVRFLSRTNRETTSLWERTRAFELPANVTPGSPVLMDWCRQGRLPLDPYVDKPVLRPRGGSETNRSENAAATLEDLRPYERALEELAAAAARLTAFQTMTNRDARAVLRPAGEPAVVLERLHLLFQVRACARLALGQDATAAEDVRTGLRLTALARQLPDVRSTGRGQALLTRSLQPLWEGLSQHAWTEAQLAGFQHDLADFNLLADFTNAVRRVSLAYIEVWRAIPDGTRSPVALPSADGGYRGESVWQLQPRAWWFENCVELYNAGRIVVEQVDAASGRIQQPEIWSELNGLPMDNSCMELFQQSAWWGPNPASVAFAQTSVNQAILACALERFRLARGVYPESLEQLVPRFLDHIPHDAVSGRPMLYQPGERGSFILRGVGPNGRDDRKNLSSDDWLWTYSAEMPGAKK